MPRGMTEAQLTEIRQNIYDPATFIELGLSPVLRFWTGSGTVTLGGQTWSGVGEFAAIEGLESNRFGKASNVSISLVDLPGSLLAGGVLANTRAIQYQGKTLRLYLGFCDKDTGLPKPAAGLLLTWDGYADVISFSVGESADVSLSGEHFSSRLRRANGLRMTSESHNARLNSAANNKDLFYEPQNRLMGRAKAAVG